MPDVLLIGKDWRTRALLRAQLIEEGVEVEAHETVADAWRRADVTPRLVVADVSASDDPQTELERLRQPAKHIPTWILANRSVMPPTGFDGYGFERVIFRPVRLGTLVEEIGRRLSRPESIR